MQQLEREPRRGLPIGDVLVLLWLVGVVYAVAQTAALWSAPIAGHIEIDLSPLALPGYALASVVRMAAAYALSIAFSLIYGRLTVSSPWAERFLLPLLDVLQSIPILSFMPGVVLALVALFPRSNTGLELAAIILIFTSQAWNLAFSFYQSLRTIPSDLHEAAVVARLNGWLRFTKLELPFATIGLVWNSMMSWAGGWFFLMAAEQFTLGDKLVWRPLVAWSDKFRFEQTESGEGATSAVLVAYRRSRLVAWFSERVMPRVGEVIDLAARAISRLPTPAIGNSATSSLVGRVVLI